jgi:O-antigen/teichoic acid export membrane protein
MVGLGPTLRLLASALFAGLPVFFASCCFALLFREREQPDVAFGWNMLGAVVGGLLEFTSMALGIKAMALLAGVAYLLALLVRERSLRAGAPSSITTAPAARREA